MRSRTRNLMIAAAATVVVSGSYFLSPSNFRLIAADGTVHDEEYASFEPMLDSTNLNPGQRTSGRISFDTAAGAEQGARIGVQGPLDTGEVGYWIL